MTVIPQILVFILIAHTGCTAMFPSTHDQVTATDSDAKLFVDGPVVGASATSMSEIEAGKEALKKRDCQSAQQHMLPQAESGNAEAQFQMGWIAGCFNRKDYPSQLKWFLLAADKGHPGAQWRASHFYTGAWSVPKDPVKALELTQKAAAKDFTELSLT